MATQQVYMTETISLRPTATRTSLEACGLPGVYTRLPERGMHPHFILESEQTNMWTSPAAATKPWPIAMMLVSILVLTACSDQAADDTSAETAETANVTEVTDESTDPPTAASTAQDSTDAASEGVADGDRSDWPDTLTFGAVPSAEEGNLEAQYAPVVAGLEEDLGLEIEFVTATDYAGVIESVIAGQIDMAQFGPFSYVIATINGAQIDPVGAMVGGPGEEPGYQSYGIVPADSDIADLSGFEGKNVCFVDPGSTSGFLYPSAGLLELGIDPETGVNPTFAGGHDASAVAVATGQCEAGFAFDAMVNEIAIREGQINDGDLKVVWESEVIAGSPLAVSTELPDSLQQAITDSILNNNGEVLLKRGLCDEELTTELDDGTQFCALTDEGVYGYAPVDDGFYDGVRAVCDTTQAPACTGDE